MFFRFISRFVRCFFHSRFAVAYKETFCPCEESASALLWFLPVRVAYTSFLPWWEEIYSFSLRSSRFGYYSLEFRTGEFDPRPISFTHFFFQ